MVTVNEKSFEMLNFKYFFKSEQVELTTLILPKKMQHLVALQ
jgi:hypothetical protein